MLEKTRKKYKLMKKGASLLIKKETKNHLYEFHKKMDVFSVKFSREASNSMM